MDAVVRGLIVYFFLLAIFRISGKRTLSQTTTFDLVLLLIISETTQQAMVDGDHSVTNGLVLILTLVGTSIFLSVLKQKWQGLERLLEGAPLIIVDKGRLNRESMEKTRVSESDLLAAARQNHGLERLDQIKYAILETSGEISIIPWR